MSRSIVLVARTMKRRSPAVFAAIALLLSGALIYVGSQKKPEFKPAPAVKKVAVEDEVEADEKDVEEEEAPVEAAPAAAVDSPARFSSLPDGSAVPDLPKGAPSRVKIGVVIYRYEGSQSPPDSERSREEAEKLAKAALEGAEKDFEAEVKKGDRGSLSNVGWIKKGILEPAVQYAVFTIDQGKLAKEIIDTPRGFWVVKRIR